MDTLKISDARKNLAELANRAFYGRERFWISRSGKPFVALISVEDLEHFEALEDYFDGLAADAAMAEGGERVTWENLKSELGL